MSGIKVGIFRGLTYEQYAAIPAINWSLLSPFKKSPAHALEDQRMGRTSEALEFGGAFHRAVLEPERFEREYILAPEYNLRRPSEREQKAKDVAALAGKGISYISVEDRDLIRAMQASAYANGRIAAMLSDPKAMKEVTVVWLDPETGMYFKARIDLLTRWGGYSWVVDLKSTKDASSFSFRKDVANFQYHGQMAHYLSGLDTLYPLARKTGFVAVEKFAPHCAVFYELDPDAVAQGDMERRSYVKALIDARTENRWPGYPDGIIGLPPWAYKEVKD